MFITKMTLSPGALRSMTTINLKFDLLNYLQQHQMIKGSPEVEPAF